MPLLPAHSAGCYGFAASQHRKEIRGDSREDETQILMGAATALAIAGLIGVEITNPSSEACAAPAAAKTSFSEDVVPIFRGRCVGDRKSTRLNSSHPSISYAVFCLKKKK